MIVSKNVSSRDSLIESSTLSLRVSSIVELISSIVSLREESNESLRVSSIVFLIVSLILGNNPFQLEHCNSLGTFC